MTERSIIKDVRFDFRYVRPRVLMGLSVVLAVYVVWLALHPTQIDIGPRLGLIDLIARSLPTPASSPTAECACDLLAVHSRRLYDHLRR